MKKITFTVMTLALSAAITCCTASTPKENQAYPDSDSIANTEAAASEENEDEGLPIGTAAPALPATDYQGNPISLSQYKDKKVVVIDFWGSWCYWCMKGVPDMKAYYNKYKGKVEYIGVNYGDEKSTFSKTIADNQMNWRHIFLGGDDQQATALLQAYQVSGFPTKVIIGLDGNVAAYIVGESDEFYNKLDELLK